MAEYTQQLAAWYTEDSGFKPHVRQHSFVEIGHEIVSTAAILSLPLTQVGQLPDSYWRKNVH